MYCIRCFSQNILNIDNSISCRTEHRSSVRKIEHVAIIKFLVILLFIPTCHIFSQITFCKLTFFVMSKIKPILLNMHFIRIQGSQIYFFIMVLL